MKAMHQQRQSRQCFRVEDQDSMKVVLDLRDALMEAAKDRGLRGLQTKVYSERIAGIGAMGFLASLGKKDLKTQQHAQIENECVARVLKALADKGHKHEPAPKDADGKEEDITKADFGRAKAAEDKQKAAEREPLPPDFVAERAKLLP